MEEVLAVRRGELFEGRTYFDDFLSVEDPKSSEIERNIRLHMQYIPRKELEENPEYKQIITYCVLISSDSGKIFSYRRAGKEKRLNGLWSLGISGHIQKPETGEDEHNIKSYLLQNINKELNAVRYLEKFGFRGYINCEDSPVNRDHFGLLYLGEVYGDDEIRIKSNSLLRAKFRTPLRIQQIFEQQKFEEWSEIAYNIFQRNNFRYE